VTSEVHRQPICKIANVSIGVVLIAYHIEPFKLALSLPPPSIKIANKEMPGLWPILGTHSEPNTINQKSDTLLRVPLGLRGI